MDYSKGPNDTGIIQINTIDSVQNFAQKEGNVTKILRTTAAPVNTIQPTVETQAAYQQLAANNSAYFVDDHGNLVEVQSYDQKIQVNVIDLVNASVESKTYDAGVLYPALTSISKDGKTYTIGINETDSTRYAGVGTPLSYSYETILEDTEMGDLALYEGRDSKTVFQFDASTDSSAGVTTINSTGKVLDLAQRINSAKNNTYAVTADGTYGFLMDGHLLIVDQDDEVEEDIILTRSASDGQIFALGNQFVVVAVDTDLRYPEVYAAVYNTDGSVKQYFHNISSITKVANDETFYEYSSLRIQDMKLYNNTIYILAKTDMDYYLIKYDVRTNTSSKEQLSIKEKTYSGFIYTMDDVKLFSADDDYFYLRDVDLSNQLPKEPLAFAGGSFRFNGKY